MNARTLLGYALGPLGGAAVGIVSLPLISWYYPAEDIGRTVLLQTVASLMLTLAGLGLDQSYVREYHAAADKAALLKAILSLPLLITLTVCGGLAWQRTAWPSEIILAISDGTLGLLCLMFLAGTVFSRYLLLILRMQDKAFAFSLGQLSPKVLILVLVLVYVAAGLPTGTFTLILAYVLAQAVTIVVLLWQTRRELKAAAAAPFSTQQLKESLRYGVPLALGGLAYWGFTSIDRFLLKELAGLSELGIYSMAVSFGAAALIVQNIFSVIWAPMVFRWVNENTHLDKIGGIAATMADLVAALICIVGIFSPLVTWVLPEKYAPVQFILLSSMLFPLLYTLTEVTGIGINVSRKTWLVTVFSLTALLVNAALLYVLAPALGAKGAAISTAVAFWVFSVLKSEASARLWLPLPRAGIYGTVSACLAVCLAYTYSGNSSNYYIFALLWLAALTALYRKHRAAIGSLAAKVKGRLKK
ncbi:MULTISPECIES: lipopolysaccharide biosynthesis protein [unclassified Neisseria]|uniref:lipopolysaccharide biosynthesis protein n=1 Tax=unclassified Neisseria TaxID=2623750 RepID=UPI001071C994|nr:MULTISPECIES: oligosaccharide flippase family protein [unclassified Neisseria]MBF0803990.1 oligosaccharide flippase family protein [Neisseria sp. 19428wB4_WF04]TFU43261.1 lipopolysaccharide biosynthesis protein [Neisseria sp. WF04]